MLRRSRRKGAAPPPCSLSLILISLFTLAACERAEPPSSPHPSPEPSGARVGTTDVGGPLAGLTADQLRLFDRGSIVFQVEFAPGNGLGPLFDAAGCANCHESPVVGGGGEAEEEEGAFPGRTSRYSPPRFQAGCATPWPRWAGPSFRSR